MRFSLAISLCALLASVAAAPIVARADGGRVDVTARAAEAEPAPADWKRGAEAHADPEQASWKRDAAPAPADWKREPEAKPADWKRKVVDWERLGY